MISNLRVLGKKNVDVLGYNGHYEELYSLYLYGCKFSN